MTTATERQAHATLRSLRKFYELGKKVLADKAVNEDESTYGRKVSQKHADRLGVSKDTIDKARHFATAYTQQDFEELTAARTPDGMPLGRAHVTLLLRVTNKTQRKALQKQALREGWPFEQLRKVIRARSPRRSRGGRRPARPTTVEAAILQIDEMANAWIRWHENLNDAQGEDAEPSGITLADLPKQAAKLLTATIPPITALQAWLSKASVQQGQNGESVPGRTKTSKVSKRQRVQRRGVES